MTAIMFAMSLSAQYIPLPGSNAVWSVDFVKYSIVGDSTYKSKRYKKIYIANYSYPTIKKVFFALIRQDKPSQKVFVIFKNDPNEKLLYDFSLNTDDIVEVDGHYPYFDYSYHTSKVQIGQIDDVIIDSLPRKRMEIKGVDWMYGAPEYWIEGIGSTLGFLSSGITGIGILDICYPTLLCLEQDSVITYQGPVVKKC